MSSLSEYVKTLDNLTDEEKIKSITFYNKRKYINSVGDKLISITHEKVDMGYGNVNSKIVIIFRNKEHMKKFKKRIEKILENTDSIFSDIYITFLDKTKNIPYDKYLYLSMELSAIKPILLYYVSDTTDEMIHDKDIRNIVNSLQKALKNPPTFYYVTEEQLSSENIEIRKQLWQKFRFIINYKERI